MGADPNRRALVGVVLRRPSKAIDGSQGGNDAAPRMCTGGSLLPWWASQTLAADCNCPEYGSSESSEWVDAYVAPCTALGIPLGLSVAQVCTDDRLAAAKADVDWVLSGDAAALEA